MNPTIADKFKPVIALDNHSPSDPPAAGEAHMGSRVSRGSWFPSKTPNPRRWEFDHGEHCACLVLAAAVGAGPDAVSCYYCQHVLQKHWQVTCDHGKHDPAEPTTSASERWRDLGRIDAVKALLVKEGGGS